MDEDKVVIEFMANIAQIASAIKFSGNGQGVRLTLDIPESELLAALKLTKLREMALKVSITPADDQSGFGE